MTTEPKPQHTPGPLTVGGRLLSSDDDTLVATAHYRTGRAEANAAHLAACWNACERAGIDPVAVPELVELVRKLAEYGHDEHCDVNAGGPPMPCSCFCDAARAALATARPEPKGETDGSDG